MHNSLKSAILALTTIAGAAVALKYNFQKPVVLHQPIPGAIIEPVAEVAPNPINIAQSIDAYQGWKDIAFSLLSEYKKEAAAGMLLLVSGATFMYSMAASKNKPIVSGLVSVASAAYLAYAFINHEAPAISI